MPQRLVRRPSGRTDPKTNTRWGVRFIVLAAIWGLSFLFIKVGDESFAPIQVSFGRLLCGTVFLAVLLFLRGRRLPSGTRTWGHLAVAAVFLNAVPFSLFAYGETHMSSVLAGIFNSTAPLFVIPIAVLVLPGERLSASRLLGLAIGFVGVLTVLGVWRGLGVGTVRGDLLCLGAAASYGVGFPYAQRFLAGRAEPLSLAVGQLLCGTFELAVLVPILSGAPHEVPARVVAAVVALGAVGTGFAYVLNFSIIRDAGASVASIVAYVIPVFSTLAGVVVLAEPLTWNEPVGTMVIIVGALAAQDRFGRIHAARDEAE